MSSLEKKGIHIATKEEYEEMAVIAVRNQNLNRTIAHYTSLDTFLSMLNNATTKGEEIILTLWASAIFAMNDPSEMKYGYDVLFSWLPKVEKELNIGENETLSNIWKNVDAQKSDDYYNNFLKDCLYNYDRIPYVISFSNKKDNLTMYRLYADDASGVCLEFSYGLLNEHGKYTYDVQYDKKYDPKKFSPRDMLSAVYELYKEKIEEGQNEFSTKLEYLTLAAMIAAPFIKRKDFEDEDEVRLSQLCTIADGVKFRKGHSGNMIPYVEIQVPFCALKKVWIGPNADFDTTKRILDLMFESKGIVNLPKDFICKSSNCYHPY